MGVEIVSGRGESKRQGRNRGVKQSRFREFNPSFSGGVSDEISIVLESTFAAEEAVGSGSDGGHLREEREEGRGRDAVGMTVERDEERAETVVGLRDEGGGFSEMSGLLVGEERGIYPIVPVFRNRFESDQ